MSSSGSGGVSGSSEPSAKKAKRNGFDNDEDEENYDSDGSELDPEVEEALRKYAEQIEASEGFDVDDYPPYCGEVGYIVPFLMPNKEFTDTNSLKKLNNCSIVAMKDFNVNNGTNYKFGKVLKANSRVVQGVIFYITFEAKDDDEDETEIFQARVYSGIGRVEPEPEVMMCRRKPTQVK